MSPDATVIATSGRHGVCPSSTSTAQRQPIALQRPIRCCNAARFTSATASSPDCRSCLSASSIRWPVANRQPGGTSTRLWGLGKFNSIRWRSRSAALNARPPWVSLASPSSRRDKSAARWL